MKKIYYSFFDLMDNVNMFSHNILCDSRVSYPIENLFVEEKNKDKSYYDCPAWAHKSKRSFSIKSPYNYKISVSFGDEGVEINSESFSRDTLEKVLSPTFTSDNWYTLNPKSVVLQFSSPSLLLWTDEKNIWVEQKSHPLTSLNNNYTCVNGWFNLSSWLRPIVLTTELCDINKPLDIKRGDILYDLCFYSQDLNDNYKLIQKTPSDKIIKKMLGNTELKNYHPTLSSRFIFQNQKKKCPFEFLFKK